MNNLEKIKAAWKMGWAAQFLYEGQICDVVSIMNNAVQVRILSDSSFKEFNKTFINEVEITGYLYAGQLAGKEPIPEGQKFKIKKTGEIAEANPYSMSESFISLKAKRGDWAYTKNEIEPYFD